VLLKLSLELHHFEGHLAFTGVPDLNQLVLNLQRLIPFSLALLPQQLQMLLLILSHLG